VTHYPISILAVSQTDTVSAIRKAIRHTLRRKVNRKKKCCNELKGTSTTLQVKQFFYNQIKELKFGIYSMTITKQATHDHLKRDAESKDRLYNFIARQVLDAIPFGLAAGAVDLIVDKSKGKRGIAEFNKYIIAQLSGRLDPKCRLNIFHRSSSEDMGLSAADLFCWGIARSYEMADQEWLAVYREKVLLNKRYY
jgi:hypothetical protein